VGFLPILKPRNSGCYDSFSNARTFGLGSKEGPLPCKHYTLFYARLLYI